MYTPVGVSQLGVRIDFFNDKLTDHAREIGMITIPQFLRINTVEYDNKEKIIYLDCELFEHLLN